jgi:imidazolonepropionase
MPGFIDASLNLSLGTRQSEGKRRRVGDFYEDSLTLLRSCLQHGTLSAEIKASADTQGYRSDISVLRKLAYIGSNPVRMVRTWRVDPGAREPGPADEDDFLSTLTVLSRRKLMHSVEFTPSAESSLDENILAIAEEGRIKMKLLWPGGRAELLLRLLDQYAPATVRCVSQVTSAEAALFAERNITAVFGTGKEVFEGPSGTSARQVADAGAPIALSSGYQSSSAASFSMQMSVSLAVARMGLTPEEAIIAATINAAHAIGCAHLTGSLETGKQADMIMLNVADYREVSRQFGINHVEMAMREGTVVLNKQGWRGQANRESA